MISVTMVGANVYEAVLEDAGGVAARHRITLSPTQYRRLSGGAFTHEWLIVQALRVLRAHDVELPDEFDLETMERDVPDFAAEVRQRLNR